MQRTDDLENRLRRNNLHIRGLPEHSNSQHPCDFAERWLKEMLPEARFSSLFAEERAHRVPACPLPPGAPPRPLLICLLSNKDKVAALQASRKSSSIMELLFQFFLISLRHCKSLGPHSRMWSVGWGASLCLIRWPILHVLWQMKEQCSSRPLKKRRTGWIYCRNQQGDKQLWYRGITCGTFCYKYFLSI